MRAADFDYELPPELIAQTPASGRDQSRLLVLHRADGSLAHRTFPDLLSYMRAGDLLVLNDSRVIPARLRGRNHASGGEFELLLLEENSVNDWWAMVRPGKRARLDTRIDLVDHAGQTSGVQAIVLDTNEEGHRRLQFAGVADLKAALLELGELPLPHYIKRAAGALHPEDLERYQTVYAEAGGSVAAPTAGLHFTAALLQRIRGLGVGLAQVTLHVGPGTFAPVKADELRDHVMHEERFSVSEETARLVNLARDEQRRVIAIGTTSLRVLESVAAAHDGRLVAGAGRTRIFVHPPYRFRLVDALLTNFHLPRSTLLMLASAFAAPGETRGRELMLNTYAAAIRERYRFFSYGDAMLIL